MIVECPSCHARYMMPIGLLASGGRKVRCARCKNEWRATLPTNTDVFVPMPAPELKPAAAPAKPPGSAGFFAPARPPIPPPITAEPRVDPAPSAPAIANLPALIARQDWKKIIYRFLGGLALLAGLALWPILDRDPIVKAIPQLRDFYESWGLPIKHTGEGLLFEQVKSELRYDGGTMRLYVDGVIHNDTGETQLVPDMRARALGPDQRVIQSWWVEPPAATIAAGSDLPFHTEVSAPMKRTIENVSLAFYAQDEKADVLQ